MTPLVSIRRSPSGPRVWVAGQRLHHGATGCALALLGAVLAAHDRADWRIWFVREALDKAARKQ